MALARATPDHVFAALGVPVFAALGVPVFAALGVPVFDASTARFEALPVRW